METKLAKIAQIARERPKEQFTSLAHLLNVEMLRECHQELNGNKASGIDEITKTQYAGNLTENLEKLHESLKMMTYKPQAVRRVYIPKPGSSKKRPLGILIVGLTKTIPLSLHSEKNARIAAIRICRERGSLPFSFALAIHSLMSVR